MQVNNLTNLNSNFFALSKMPRPLTYCVTKFSKKEGRILLSTLVSHEAWDSRTFVGPNRQNCCILIDEARIRNPFPKGPRYVTPVQIAWIARTGHLPNNAAITSKKYEIELSHVCGRSNCINVVGRHILAEEHWKNMRRKKHHKLIRSKYQSAMSKATEKRMRAAAKKKYIDSNIKLSRSECSCNRKCFKFFWLTVPWNVDFCIDRSVTLRVFIRFLSLRQHFAANYPKFNILWALIASRWFSCLSSAMYPFSWFCEMQRLWEIEFSESEIVAR